MKNENEKKGFLESLFGSKENKKGSCCCNFEVEEISEENEDYKNENETPKEKGNSCCK